MKKNQRIYLDYNATTPCDPRVVETMLPFFTTMSGNAASRSHPYGWEAEEAVAHARGQIARLIGAQDKEIIFTSGATEGDNLALKGVFEMYRRKGNHIITVETEHKAVLDTCLHIEKVGGEVTYLKVDETGLIDLSELKAAIKETTVLVSIMWANNETGVIQPMAEIGKICEEEGTITGNLGRHPANRTKQTVYADGEGGKHAVTHYKVLLDMYYVSLIECQLETGRTHQIRVHMQHTGHPLFNDAKYGGDKVIKGTVFDKYRQFVENCFKMIPRHVLHAKSIGFVHPKSGEQMLFESELPEDFQAVLDKWERYLKGRRK